MTGGEDDSGPTKDKKTTAELKTHDPAPGQSTGMERNDTKVVPLLPNAPVIADAGTTRSIEGTAQSGQILPFESQVQGHIGRQLRALYDDVLDQPIPDRFLALLSELDGKGLPGFPAGEPTGPGDGHGSRPEDTDLSDPKGDA